MAWTILVLAGFLEVGWAVGLKYADGFTRVVPSVLTIASMIASIVLLGVAMKSIPLGTAYAVWTGIGTVGALIAGMILFGDSTSPVRLLCAGLIVAGIAGLKLSAA
jgi:quaternary ammonium compound-resistance protein SugE